MEDNTHRINRQTAITMAICSLVFVCLMVLNYMSIFDFDGPLTKLIPIVGFTATLTPIVLYQLKVPDKFLKYYMSVAMAIVIGSLGCFNNIGVYITFILVPVASCLYFDPSYTVFCSVFSYLVMAVAVFFNSAGKFETVYLGWSHMQTFRAYMIGFTIEYIVVSLYLALIMRRARAMLSDQHEAYLAQLAQDAKYQLLVKETKDIVFEYYPKDETYIVNRAINPGNAGVVEPGRPEPIEKGILRIPGLAKLRDQINEGIRTGHLDEFELDMTYTENETEVPRWFNVEYFAVKDGEHIVSVIGKMHDITRSKQAQEAHHRQQLADIYQDSKRKNSLYQQVLAESVHFKEAEYERLASGHRFLAEIMEDVKYEEDLSEGIRRMLEKVGEFFGMDRICVVETDISSGTSAIHYQWSSRPENAIEAYFPTMSVEEISRTIHNYDANGYIEVNPSENIATASEGNEAFFEKVVYSVLLGNQIWIPMLANGRYIGAISFDRFDKTLYTSVEKFLLSEAVNMLTAHILKINAENSNKAKSEFLSTMSHEIRTPMNAIVGMTEVALREDMPEGVKNSLRMVKSSAFGLLTLINDILDYSKIEAGRFDIVPEDFALLSILNDVKEIVTARNSGKLALIFEVPDDIPKKVHGDSVRIKQVMINYCTNAIKYSDRGTVRIRVSLEKKSETQVLLHFSVQDQGIGIRKEDLPKLFQSYTRVDETVNHHKEGTGLGLAISRQLVELMDGTVNVESEYGKGSTFSFVVPLGVADWEPSGRLEDYKYEERNAVHEETEEIVIAPNAQVLIVDDTELNLLVAEALMEPTQMQIDKAESGADALRMIGKKTYDLIFMDHFMPGMDGVETTQKIRALADETKRQIPIVALTADAMEGVREELLSKGMNDFLTKPIIVKDLYKILRAWLPADKIEV